MMREKEKKEPCADGGIGRLACTLEAASSTRGSRRREGNKKKQHDERTQQHDTREKEMKERRNHAQMEA